MTMSAWTVLEARIRLTASHTAPLPPSRTGDAAWSGARPDARKSVALMRGNARFTSRMLR
jgi:hypothetical protein